MPQLMQNRPYSLADIDEEKQKTRPPIVGPGLQYGARTVLTPFVKAGDILNQLIQNRLADLVGRGTGYQFIQPLPPVSPGYGERRRQAGSAFYGGLAERFNVPRFNAPFNAPRFDLSQPMAAHEPTGATPGLMAAPYIPATNERLLNQPFEATSPYNLRNLPVPAYPSTSRARRETMTPAFGGKPVEAIYGPTTDEFGRSLYGLNKFYEAMNEARLAAFGGPPQGRRATEAYNARVGAALNRANAIAGFLGQGASLANLSKAPETLEVPYGQFGGKETLMFDPRTRRFKSLGKGQNIGALTRTEDTLQGKAQLEMAKQLAGLASDPIFRGLPEDEQEAIRQDILRSYGVFGGASQGTGGRILGPQEYLKEVRKRGSKLPAEEILRNYYDRLSGL